jgi:hypothetical protein
MKTAILRINDATHKRLKIYCETRGSTMRGTATLAIEGFLMRQAHLMPDLKRRQKIIIRKGRRV